MNRIIEAALTLTKNQLAKASEKKIVVEKELGDLPSIQVDPNQILEVFVNILINAVDAMPQKGTLKVMSRKLEAEPFMEIRFTDTGCGISAGESGQNIRPVFYDQGSGKGDRSGPGRQSWDYGEAQRDDRCGKRSWPGNDFHY